MEQDIIRTARKKFQKLAKAYPYFINVFVDDWRGYRFVLDTRDVRRCKNRCRQCPLFLLLKNERPQKKFSASLYPASAEDKKIFGPQHFLNCKTLQQYTQCYAKFLATKTQSEREIAAEFDLARKARVIFSRDRNPRRVEQKFRHDVLRQTLCMADPKKCDAIQAYRNRYLTSFRLPR